MKRSNVKKSRRDRPSLPELDQTKRSVLNSLTSLQSRRSYQHAMDEFIEWYCSEPRLALNRAVVLRYPRRILQLLREQDGALCRSISLFLYRPQLEEYLEGVEIDLNAAPVGPQIVRAYLSRQHFENVKDSCPMVALPSDVARAGKTAKRAFEGVFAAMVSFLERDVRHRSRDTETAAQAIAALCVGGMVVARAMDDRGHADRLRDAFKAVALRLGGWEEKAEKGYA